MKFTRYLGCISFDAFCDVLVHKAKATDQDDLLIKVFDELKGPNGLISLSDLRRGMAEIGEDIPEAELRQMIEETDEDCDGYVNRDEFLKIMTT